MLLLARVASMRGEASQTMSSRRTRQAALVESLEPRALCAAAPLPWPLALNQVSQADGTVQLQIIASQRRNAISVTTTPGGLVVSNAGVWTRVVQGSFSSILIYAGAGQDSALVD